MSLSPRPEMFTITTSDFFIFGARLITSATAWADSSARSDALGACEQSCRFERFCIRGGQVLGATRVVKRGVLGADRRIVQTGGDRVRGRDLPGRILKHIHQVPCRTPGEPAAKTGCVLAQRLAAASGFDPDEFNFFVFDEIVEDSYRVRSSADAGDDSLRKFAFGFENLRAGFASDDAMEVAHHGWIGMRSEHAPEQVMRGADIGDPVAHGFVDGVFEGARSGMGHCRELSMPQPHAEDVEFLAAHVFGAHVDYALEAEQGADGGGGDSMLTSAGFGDHAMLAHAFDEQALSEAIVDLVRAGISPPSFT